MTKREKKLNNIWLWLQKHCSKEVLEKYNTRAFLYSVGRLSYEQVLIELVGCYFGKGLDDPELTAVIEIMNK